MDYLIAFLSGIIFACVALPLLGDFVEYIEAKKAVKISAMNVVIAQNNKLISDITGSSEKDCCNAIGFQYDDNQDETYEYEEGRYENRRAGF